MDISVSSLSADTCYEQNESILKVFIERGDNSYSLKSLIFNLYSSSGKKMTYIPSQILAEGEKNTYSIKYSSISSVDRFEVIPTIQVNNSLKNCSRLVVSAIYPCKLPEPNNLSVDTGINIPYSSNNYSNNSSLTNTSSNTTNSTTNISLGGSSGYSSGGSSGISDSDVNISSYYNSTSTPSTNTSQTTNTASSSSNSLPTNPASSNSLPAYSEQNSAPVGISTCQELQNMQITCVVIII